MISVSPGSVEHLVCIAVRYHTQGAWVCLHIGTLVEVTTVKVNADYLLACAMHDLVIGTPHDLVVPLLRWVGDD